MWPLMLLLITGFRTLFLNLFSRLWVFIVFALPWIVEKIIVLLGVGLVTFTGFDLIFSQIETYVITNYNNIGGQLLQLLNMMGVLTGINIVLSSMTAVLGYKAAVGSRKLLFKKQSVLEA